MKTTALILSLALAGSAYPPEAAAQRPLSVQIHPRAGLIAPDASLYEAFANFSGDGPVEWTGASLGRAALVGVGMAIARGEAWSVRLEVLSTVRGWLLADHGIVMPRVLFDPPWVQHTWFDVPYSALLLGAHAVLPLRARIGRVEPYVLLGGGGRRYAFGEPTRTNDVGATLPTDGFSWQADLGGGLTVDVGDGLVLDLQIRDAVSRYWGHTQNDLVYTGALLVKVR